MDNYKSELHEPGALVSVIGNFVMSIKKVYVRSRLRGFACACRISTSMSDMKMLVLLTLGCEYNLVLNSSNQSCRTFWFKQPEYQAHIDM